MLGGDFTTAGSRVSPYLAEFGRDSATWSQVEDSDNLYASACNWLCGAAPTAFDRLFIDATAAGYATPASITMALPLYSTDPIAVQALRVRTDTVRLDLRSHPFTLTSPDDLNEPSLVVGDLDDVGASLTIDNDEPQAATFTASTVVVGNAAGSSTQSSVLRIQDANSDFVARGALHVGRKGNRPRPATGSWQATHDDFVVQRGSAQVDGLISVGEQAGSAGEIRVQGSTGLLLHSNAPGPGLLAPGMDIGGLGSGSLVVQGGGQMASMDRMGTLSVGQLETGNSGARGEVRITGAGSMWDVAALQIYFGYAAPTRVRVLSGGRLITDAPSLIVGRYPQAAASVSVSGTGSRWDHSGPIRIGDGAELAVSSGGSVLASVVTIDEGGSLRGQVEIAGGGALAADVNNFGTIDVTNLQIDQATDDPVPGAGPATLTITGNLQQIRAASGRDPSRSGLIRLTLHDTGGALTPDRLIVDGEARLAGGLVIDRAASASSAVVAGAGPANPLRAATTAAAARRARGVLPELRRAQHGSAART
jgi:T5SS/PEP-CTERM-associated repeat protein